MTPLFKQLCRSCVDSWKLGFSGLVMAQAPEAFLIFLNQATEVFLTDYPKITFVLLYPLTCLASALGSVLTLKVIGSPASTFLNAVEIKKLSSSLIPLFLTSAGLGLVVIPATLALVIPGIYLLSQYLFLPFVVVAHPGKKIGWYFAESKRYSQHNRGLCLFTAAFSFFISVLSLLGVSIIEAWFPLPSSMDLIVELVLGILFSLLLNTWLVHLWRATQFLEITNYERPS